MVQNTEICTTTKGRALTCRGGGDDNHVITIREERRSKCEGEE
jgi:hypothetical protein